MRSTCSLYIDTGYLLAAAATRVTGTSLRRGIHVEYGKLIANLIQTAEEHSGVPLLRVHWYDSARKGIPDAQQERIGEIPKVKLRLGRFGYDGEQKGVDLRIGLDLVTHARNRTSDTFFLVSGDDDLTEAVEEAQIHGVQVTLLAVPDAADRAHGVNRHLIRAVDDVYLIDGATVDAAIVAVQQPPAPATPESAAPAVPVEHRDDAVAPVPKPRPRPGRAGAPSPLELAGRAPAASPRPVPARHAPPPVVAYSSSTGSVSHIAPEYDDGRTALLDGVVSRVVESFRKSADALALADLERSRPSIPREIDRALLLDACEALDVDDLDQGVRFALRERFWTHHDAGENHLDSDPAGPAQ